MRRILILSMTIVFVGCLLVPSVFAAKFKVPKAACYTLSSFNGPWPLEGAGLVLTFRPSGMKAKISSGTQKFYSIQGALGDAMGEYWNVTGSGYLIDLTDLGDEGGMRFDGDFTGRLIQGPINCSYWLHSEFGSSMVCQMANVAIDGGGSAFSDGHVYLLNDVDCKSVPPLN